MELVVLHSHESPACHTTEVARAIYRYTPLLQLEPESRMYIPCSPVLSSFCGMNVVLSRLHSFQPALALVFVPHLPPSSRTITIVRYATYGSLVRFDWY